MIEIYNLPLYNYLMKPQLTEKVKVFISYFFISIICIIAVAIASIFIGEIGDVFNSSYSFYFSDFILSVTREVIGLFYFSIFFPLIPALIVIFSIFSALILMIIHYLAIYCSFTKTKSYVISSLFFILLLSLFIISLM